MLNKLESFLRRYEMLVPGDRVICAVSGGADSIALLFAMYLLREKLRIQVEAAHFNHHLRGSESDRDERFVRDFCDRFDIILHIGHGNIIPGRKGLEAAARDARYAFLRSLPGKIATAHTADDNAETLLMHLVRGTGLRGLGGIMPVYGSLIRPMLSATRSDVLSFLEEYHLCWIEDSSNDEDTYLRNRIRHHVIPLLAQENPSLAENLSATALRLREEDSALDSVIPAALPGIFELRTMHPGIRGRALSRFLNECGIREPEARHIEALEKLVFSDKPSAQADFPNGIVISRNYNRLVLKNVSCTIQTQKLSCPIELNDPAIRITIRNVDSYVLKTNCFTVSVCGDIYLRSRQAGDRITLSGGSKDLKKLFIDRKIPAGMRSRIPVICDEIGVLGVYGIGANLSRMSKEPPYVEICFEEIQ